MDTLKSAIFCAALLCAPATVIAQDDGYIVGIGLAFDNGDGYSATGFVDYSFNAAASVSALFTTTRAKAFPDSVTTRDWSVGARYDFGPIVFEAAGGQSGDPDDFDSDDLRVGVLHSGDNWRLGLSYLHRDIDLVFRFARLPDAPQFSLPLKADGFRYTARYRTDQGFSIGASTTRFDYDRDLSPLSGRFIAQRLSPTTLTLSSALRDRSTTLDMEFPLQDNRAINLLIARDRLAGNLGEVDSFGIGFLTPAGERADLDLSVGLSRGDGPFDGGNTVFVSVLYLYYGGFD